MKIDRKFRKTLSEIPNDCKQLIEKLKSCHDNDQLLAEICAIKSWNIGKCELYHWADVLDRFNSILEQACTRKPDPITSWQLSCDLPENSKLKTLLLAVLQFTALLIEHSYSRHLYNSIEHLTTLLESTDFLVILSVLNLLYVFSKRSIFINRLASDKKQALLQRLVYLAESWGGKENGLDLVKCCLYTDLSSFPASATAVNFEYTVDTSLNTNETNTNQNNNNSKANDLSSTSVSNVNKTIVTKHVKLEKVHTIHENPAIIMEHVLKDHPDIPEDKRVLLYTYIRLAHSFPNYEKRKLFVQTRLQSLSILVYSGAIQEHANNLLYDGLIEELVDVLTVKDSTSQLPIPPFPEIKAASLKTLTAIIHLEKTNKLTEIIETTQASSYHGLLPTLVRKCVDHLIDPTKEPFPHQFATSLFSFLYHLATYDTGGDALVKCGIMETLLKVVNHNHNSQEFIMFVTRAVRVIDLITNLDMSSFESHSGLTAFINRLEYEVNECRKENPYVIKVKRNRQNLNQSSEQIDIDLAQQHSTNPSEVTSVEELAATSTNVNKMETSNESQTVNAQSNLEEPVKIGLTCYHQRSALLKSILNFFKKAIADSSNNNVPNLGDSIRHMMEGSLPESLKHIISNADYYGPSLFLLGTDVVQLFIFQEPSQLSQLQENGLTDVILYALLKKNVPATREVLGSLPTVFSALCLNTAGLNAFIESKPFDKLFQVLLSPDYLPAMRRRRNADQVNGANINGATSSSGTAHQLGSAMDELMRHQPSLRVEAINSIINLLNQLIEMGRNPNYICQRQSSSSSSSSSSNSKSSSSRLAVNVSNLQQTSAVSSQRLTTSNTTNTNSGEGTNRSTNDSATGGDQNAQQSSSDDENNMDEYENAVMMVDSENNIQQQQPQSSASQPTTSKKVDQPKQVPQAQQLESIPLLDYITNIMKFIEAILSNNSTDDHCKEFVKQKGLLPLLEILTLPNLPIDFPSSTACQSVAQVCKAILHLAREPQVIDQALNSLSKALENCEKHYKSYILNRKKSLPLTDGSVLLCELGQADNPVEASNSPQQTPLLHSICSVHSLIYLLITLGKINQNDVRNLITTKWGSELGVNVLKDLSKLYSNLIWESSMLLWLCNEEQQQQHLQQLIQIQQFQQQQLTQLSQQQQDLSVHQAATNQLNQLIQQLSSNSSGTAQSYFEFNRVDLEKIKNFLTSTNTPQPVTETSDNNEMETTGTDTSESKIQTQNVSYNKLLRPLFNSSSKLGRSLCEMFGLLVKLSAGSWKNTSTRRNMISNLNQNATPSQAAINVATSLADISISGFSVKKSEELQAESFVSLNDITNLHPKFRLTFYICSIGFTSSILFDEQKRPYHLMIQRFDQLGGLKALFDVFYWSLSLLNQTSNLAGNDDYQQMLNNQDRDRLQEGTLEFIEAWLQLIQKLVNTKNMLETRYSLNPNPSSSSYLNSLVSNSEIKKVCSFDPIKFLFKIQKEAFQALMCLWDNKSFIIRENYTLSETVLNILCQILVGDTQLQKKLAEQKQQQQQQQIQSSNTSSSLANSLRASFQSLQQQQQQAQISNANTGTSNPNPGQNNTSVPTRQLTALDQEILMQMISMGFSAELAQEAVMRSPPDSLEQAVEYCFNHPNSGLNLNNQTTTTTSTQTLTSTSSNNEPARPVIEQSESMNDDDISELNNRTKVVESSLNKEKNETEQEKTDKTEKEEEIHQLDKEILDRFASTMLPGLMKILDNVPDCVYRVCDLIVVVVGKYGDEWRDNCLTYILNETCDLIKQVSDYHLNKSSTNNNNTNITQSNVFIEQKLASRLLLFCLLFEEMQLPCSRIVNSSNLLEKLVSMLQMITNSPTIFNKQSNTQLNETNTTPVWLTSLFILIDLIEKASLSTKRKAAINEQFKNYQRVWKWYEERQNRWVPYAYANNKTIDQAYKNGETSVRIVASRKHYIIHFNTMLQENEESLHKRPVMLSFEKPTFLGVEQPPDSTNSRPSTPLPTEVVNGLESSQISAVIESCVELISWPVSDPDCLHAILRLILRLTRQHEYAIEFAARRGPQYILNLTQRNSFMGYASLITLIFRHICEDEKNLRLTMEKAIRLALTGSQVNIAGLQPGGIGSRELNNVLRLLGPAICRHPDLFCEVACDILRIIIRREDEQILNTNNIATLEKPIEQQLNNNTAYCLRTVAAKLMPATPMPDYARELVIDLLNYLIKPNFKPDSKVAETNKLSGSDIPKTKTNPVNAQQPLISKSGVLRILSELVRSYAGCAKIVAQHVYKTSELLNQIVNQTTHLNDDCNALAFLLDNLLASNQTFGDKDCPSLCRLLIVALASCNHCLDSQNALVQEVKQALSRAVNLPESNDKHIKIQAFASIINTMIETCPPIHNAGQQQQQTNSQTLSMVNNMMKIMHKKGLINDLARVPLYMDLSCSKCIETINTILKPLETMTKTLNISSRKTIPQKMWKSVEMQQRAQVSTAIPANDREGTTTSTVAPAIETVEVTSRRVQTPITEEQRIEAQQHSGVTSDVAGLNLTTDANIVLGDAAGSVVTASTSVDQHNISTTADENMVDLNMTEMEPQQTLPQDIDMLPATSHHHRRELDERVFDRVIEALNQEESESESDSEYESQDRIIHIEADNDGNQIHIEIGPADEEEEEDEDEDEDEDADLGLTPRHDALNNSSGEDDEEHESEDERVLRHELNDIIEDVNERNENEENEVIDESDDEEEDESDDEDEHEEEEDDDENIIDEEIVEGSDGRSAESDLSDDEQNASNRNSAGENLPSTAEPHQDGGVIMDTTGIGANGGVITTNNNDENVSNHRRRRRRHRHDEDDNIDFDDEDEEEESIDEDEDEEDMDLDDEGEHEIEDENQIIEEGEEDEEENEDEDEDEEEEDEEDNEEDEEDEASEYFDAYNQMLDFINDENEHGEEDDFLNHIENLWQTHGNQSNHIVLGHQLGIGNTANRNYQINILGGANNLGLSSNVDGSVPPHPLSVSAVHPLLVNHSESSNVQTATGANAITSGNGFQVTGLGLSASGGLSNLGSAISPILRTMRQLQSQQQAGQMRPVRFSRFVLPSAQAGTSQANQQPLLSGFRTSTLPYNTLNEILQGYETPAAALQPAPSIITAPTATSFMDLLSNTQQTTGAAIQPAPSNIGVSASNTALASLNNQEFLVNLNSYNNDGFGENIGNGTTNLYIIRTPLARWNEECTVLDSHSMHHAILLNKPKIMEALEKYRNDELNEKREKKLKEEKEKQKKLEQAAAAASAAASISTNNQATPEETSQERIIEDTPAQVNLTIETQPIEPTPQTNELAQSNITEQPSDNTNHTSVQMEAEENNQETISTEQYTPSNQQLDETTNVTSNNVSADNQTEATSSTTRTSSPFQTQADREAATNFLINFVGTTCSVFTLNSADERRVAIEALRMAEHQRASLELQAATSETTNYPQNYVFLDGHVVEIPSGIDPSFLSALPDSLRREVIMEQLRILGIDIRNRPIPATTTTVATNNAPSNPNQTANITTAAPAASNMEINPEFLAALPPQIQEELLTQQRIEQQARAAATGATTGEGTSAGTVATTQPAEDDNAAFMRTLPASLRQAILFDMDHSQISALPEDLATEARALQQQHREREIDLFTAAHRSGRVSGASYLGRGYRISTNRGGLEGIYNVASSLLHDTYMYGGQSRDLSRLRRGLRNLNDAEILFSSGGMLNSVSGGQMGLERAKNGRQLLDHESIACLLVLLFIDDPRMNMTKLHRVVRNLCIHSPSRAWIIKALLCILEKVSGKPEAQLSIQSAFDLADSKQTPGHQTRHSKQLTKSPGASTNNSNNAVISYQPSWLTMSIDGAFGSKTNVFTILKPSNSRKSTSTSKLTPPVSAQSDLQTPNLPSILINQQACPAILKQILEILSTLARAANFNFFPRNPFPPSAQPTQTQKQHLSKSHFWDIVVKLDQSKNKNSKMSSLSSSSSQKSGDQALSEFDSDLDFNVENSPLARLMSALDYPVLKNNPHLMDKMFTCLSYASSGIPQIDSTKTQFQPSRPVEPLTSQLEPSQSTDNKSKPGEPIENLNNEAVLSKQIELVVNVLKNKLCTQDGLQQAYTLLNNLSKINSATRNMILKHLLKGTRELGLAVCKEIETLLDEAIKYNQITAATQPTTSTGAPGGEETMDSTNAPTTSLLSSFSQLPTRPSTTQQTLIDSYSNLVISSPKTKQTRELQLPSMSVLVEKNSNQKFFVRLIRLIISLRETIEKEAKKKKNVAQQQAQLTETTEGTGTSAAETGISAEQQPQLPRLSTELDLDQLWNKLSECLTVLKSLSDPYAVLILQQTVEGFFYVHATRKDKDETRKREKETKETQLAHLDTESSPMSPGLQKESNADPHQITSASSIKEQKNEIEEIINSIGAETSPDTKKFLEFALTHRTVLNHILRQTSNNLSEEPYSVLVDFTRLHTHILDFDVKRRYFRQELDKLKDSIRGDDLAIHVRRTHVFDDSFRELNRRSPDDWKHRFYIVFEGEEGQDAGGLLREWYMIISKEIFNPDYALFMINPGDRVTYMPNPSSHCNPNHLSYFKFIGHIIAKAIFDNKFLDCYFTRAFYKHILGVPVKYTDMESVDNEFYKNLVSILESDIDTLGIDLFFTIDINEFGVTQSRDLKPNGRNIKVTNENKSEYVRLVCQEKMIGSIRQQVSAFLQGFYEIIPKSLISIFNEQELELLISGLPEIDLEDLKRNTEYHKYTSSSLQIQWFWRALKAFDKEDQAKFLQFVTGTSKVPLQGFAKLEGMNGPQKFQIHRDDRDTSRLPCAHTCFNQLDLPAYENFEKLKNMLLMAIRECSTGFGLA